jgi:hypothetical protein
MVDWRVVMWVGLKAGLRVASKVDWRVELTV